MLNIGCYLDRRETERAVHASIRGGDTLRTLLPRFVFAWPNSQPYFIKNIYVCLHLCFLTFFLKYVHTGNVARHIRILGITFIEQMFWQPGDLHNLRTRGARDQQWTVLPVMHVQIILCPILVRKRTEHTSGEVLRRITLNRIGKKQKINYEEETIAIVLSWTY